TVFFGGGYGLMLGLVQENALLGEGSTLAAVALATVPIALAFARGSHLLRSGWKVKLLMWGLSGAGVATALGTYTRTGLGALAVLAALLWWRSPHKLLFALLVVGTILVGLEWGSQSWIQRMLTIADYDSETSALGRIGVWRWTLDFVAEHPLGGGFEAFIIN